MAKSNAAILTGVNQPWQIVEVDIDEPNEWEIEVDMAYAGLCHSDEHMRVGVAGLPKEALEFIGVESIFPLVGGHEGSGIVSKVGSRVKDVAVGDHVAVCFIPSCGKCRWCARGDQQLCDRGIFTLAGPMISDGTYRYHLDGQPMNRMSQLGTFSERMVVHSDSVVKLDPAVSLKAAALVSCGFATGFGAATNRADVRPGEVVVVVGVGGVGSSAVLGAVTAGAAIVVAVDPLPYKQEQALAHGATHAVGSLGEARELVTGLTHGEMADSAILTAAVVRSELIQPAMDLVSKAGRVVVVGAAPYDQQSVDLDLFNLCMFNKSLLGCMYGSSSPRVQIPNLLRLNELGRIDLEELITREYTLDQVERGYQDMLDGINIRGIVRF
jgi:S-(hydroxymethyl)glutathione dehydrogenase / alcohol dehydrogenase